MSTTDKATPRPWKLEVQPSPRITAEVGGDAYVKRQRITLVTLESPTSAALLPPDEFKANAAIIVRAVNNHEALVAALEAAERFLTDPEAGFKDYLLAQIADALASARGEAQE